MESSINYHLVISPTQVDLLISLVSEKYNQLQKLPLKRRKQLNVLYGEKYMKDYENYLYDMKHMLETCRYEE